MKLQTLRGEMFLRSLAIQELTNMIAGENNILLPTHSAWFDTRVILLVKPFNILSLWLAVSSAEQTPTCVSASMPDGNWRLEKNLFVLSRKLLLVGGAG